MVKILYSPEFEARRLVFALRSLKYTAFRSTRDIKLPKFPPTLQKQINLLLGDRNEPANSSLLTLLQNYLTKNNLLLPKNTLETLTKKVLLYYKKSLPLAKKIIDTTDTPNKIQITRFGSSGSFTHSEWTMYPKFSKAICVREDFDQERVLYLILRSLFGSPLSPKGFSGNQLQQIAAFWSKKLLGKKIQYPSPLFEGPIFTTSELAKYKAGKFTRKYKFLNEFFKEYKPISLPDEETALTPLELRIFNLLKSTKGATNYDRIAQVIWGENWEDKFSLEAIYKHISRLRNKIASTHPGVTILPVASKGYIYQK